jgi:gamma-glutamylcyclotransferase (GGCT)/AIG2-like uncharacterized protein YtfP
MQQTKHSLFVYGTLKKGFYNNSILEKGNAIFEGDSEIENFVLISLSVFPMAFFVKEKEHKIIAERYSIDDVTLKRLDRLEGYPSFYNRMIATDTKGNKGWIYINPSPVPIFFEEIFLSFDVKREDYLADGNWQDK